jgi:hypothetical protein
MAMKHCFLCRPYRARFFVDAYPTVPASRSHPNTRQPRALGTPFRSPSPWANFWSRLRRLEQWINWVASPTLGNCRFNVFRALQSVCGRDFRKWLRVHLQASHQHGDEALFFCVAPTGLRFFVDAYPTVPASRSHPNTRQPRALGTPFRSPSPWANFWSRLRRLE